MQSGRCRRVLRPLFDIDLLLEQEDERFLDPPASPRPPAERR